MINGIHDYPKVHAVGKMDVSDLFLDDVLVEEKVDGSQISFGRYNFDGVLRIRSHGALIDRVIPGMFKRAVETVESLANDLHEGWTYRGEYIAKPKHNVSKYSRIPAGGIIIYDIQHSNECYLTADQVKEECFRLGLEMVPVLFTGKITSSDQLKGLLEYNSILGGTKIEGVVIKNYKRMTRDGKVMMGKYVSEQFKESAKRPAGKEVTDILSDLILEYKTEARWQKAVQHLREDGKLENSPKDIGSLVKEIQFDLTEEEELSIRKRLFDYFMPKLLKGVVGGMPEWYKKQLMESAFGGDDV